MTQTHPTKRAILEILSTFPEDLTADQDAAMRARVYDALGVTPKPTPIAELKSQLDSLIAELAAAKVDRELFDRMADCLDEIRAVLDDTRYASRMNQLDSIRRLIDFSIPDTAIDEAHGRIYSLTVENKQLRETLDRFVAEAQVVTMGSLPAPQSGAK